MPGQRRQAVDKAVSLYCSQSVYSGFDSQQPPPLLRVQQQPQQRLPSFPFDSFGHLLDSPQVIGLQFLPFDLSGEDLRDRLGGPTGVALHPLQGRLAAQLHHQVQFLAPRPRSFVDRLAQPLLATPRLIRLHRLQAECLHVLHLLLFDPGLRPVPLHQLPLLAALLPAFVQRSGQPVRVAPGAVFLHRLQIQGGDVGRQVVVGPGGCSPVATFFSSILLFSHVIIEIAAVDNRPLPNDDNDNFRLS